MNTRALERFARSARRQLHEQVAARLERVLRTDSAELREHAAAVQQLKDEITATSHAAVVERVAYTWFNRFCALRFMDVNRYTALGVVSPAEGFTQPELLQEAKQGHIDDALPVDRQRVFDLLGGRLPAREPQQEAYRLLLVGACNGYHSAMPFLFEPIADYTELLMPDDLLSAGSILQAVRDALTPDACQDEEVIGWLYQFYIAEKKEAVDEKVKAGGKVEADELPAKTSLYTPDWIVRFLVENSLGRLWMANRPQSKLAARMKYLVVSDQLSVVSAEPGQAGASQLPTDHWPLTTPHWPLTTDNRPLTTPEDLRIADSAAGSGHMLLYAFELLYAIYEEEGYNPPDIPRLILTQNLYGMEIDARSAALAAFALTMKARRYDRRFLRRGVRPNICVLHSVHFTAQELAAAAWLRKLGENLIDLPVRDALLHDLAAAAMLDNVGSLLRPQLTPAQIERVTAAIDEADDLFTQGFNDRVRDVLAQMAFLAREYHVAVTNPPYLSKGFTDELKQFLAEEYQETKSDLFAAFTVRNTELTMKGGFVGLMTPFNWMFLSSFASLRHKILTEHTLTAMVRPEFHAFFESAFVTICAFTLFTHPMEGYKGAFIDLDQFYGADLQPTQALEAIRNPQCGWFYRASAADFKKIPGAPIAYWVSKKFYDVVQQSPDLESFSTIKEGLTTGNNDLFLRFWFEVEVGEIGIGMSSPDAAQASSCRWFPYNKGGGFRRWYGNNDYVVDWFDRGKSIHEYAGVPLDYGGAPVRAKRFYFQSGITWTRVSSASTAFRAFPDGFIFDSTGPSIFPKDMDIYSATSLLNGKPSRIFLELVAPTLDFRIGPVSRIPVVMDALQDKSIAATGQRCVVLAKLDWDNYETSWDFTTLPLLRPEHRQATLAATYASLRRHWQAMTDEMQRLEEENNRIFIEAYGLQDELTPEVPLHEITLTCNPHYRYGGQLAVGSGQLEERLLADTMRELISYAVGCMFGRYSLDKPGLILANAGETVEDYVRKIGDSRLVIGDSEIGGLRDNEIGDDGTPTPNLSISQSPNLPISFPPDRDNVIPILDGEWFADDIVERCKRFLRVTFGEAHFAENLAFVEAALGRDLRSYFLREFYDDHVRRYQKRPIYWLFSSPRGSFNALIYMHRYRPDTVSVVLNEYLRDFRSKLEAHKRHLEQVSISATATARDKSAALKEIGKLEKVIAELTAYESEVLYPLATQQVAIDLDDGVKVNYNKLGKALRRIVGVSE